ncbi:MAG: hypothetical protein QOE14_3069, partial [Humisphaera sp.]|nr:hypothetical protein [Humisphaera sp.]
MIQDLEQLDAAAAPIECDICVIGTGAAGLAIANELLDTNLRLVFLEGGGADHEPASQDLYQSLVTGHPFAGHMTGRFRVLGGSTTRWGGQALRLTPIDFQPRDWVPHSGWPIRYDQLHDYYLRASRFLEVDELDFDRDLFRLLGTQPPGFDAARVHYHFSKWSPRPDLRLAHRAKLAASTRATLLLHANVTRIRLSGDHRHVDEVTVRSLGGRSATVRAKQFVLCAGGIETARILLANNTQQPAGIGNGRDLVGRFFQD